MDLEQHSLRKFLAVVEDLNFSRAAHRLHVSQPALSQAIRRLEADLGKNLFERDSRSVTLTDFGRVFCVVARTLVAQHDRAVATALDAARGAARSFRVGYSPFVDLALVSAVRREFARGEPDTWIDLRSSFSKAQVELLAAGELDAGLLFSPFAPVPGLKAETLRREPFVVGLPRGHRLAHMRSISLDDVRGEPIIWWPRALNPAISDRFFAVCAAHGYAPVIVQEATTLQEFLEFVAQGLGITLLPRSATMLKHNRVVFRELAADQLSVDFVVAYLEGDLSEILTRFIAFVKGRFRLGP
jgi:DNA-binding transcriptional LysR family regulator